MAKDITLLAIVGPTASGKTALAIEIAKKYDGEIIAADSRTVYKGLDIGTAKPSTKEQQEIPHWGLDLVGPGELFTVADFKRYANQKIADIKQRGRLPTIVGGTGLYVDAAMYDFSLAPPNETMRRELEGLGVLELQARIAEAGFTMPENSQNRRYLVRTLERGNADTTRRPLGAGAYIIGLNPPKDVLNKRIRERAEAMIRAGVLDEVAWGLEHYGLESQAMTGGIYRIFRDVVWGKLSLEQAVDLFVQSDLRLAKRQTTWFRRNADINWFESAVEAQSWFDKTFAGTLK